jgi:UPF0755 protein
MNRPSRRSALAALALPLVLACGGSAGPTLELTVPQGALFQEVVDTLVSRGIVRSGALFTLYARIRGDDHRVRAGEYRFRTGQPWKTILGDLTAGRVMTEAVTIPEGFTLAQMAPRLAEITGLAPDSVASVLQVLGAHALDIPGPGLEGYLFPDTYLFAQGSDLHTVLETMVERYHTFWTPERRQRLIALGMTEKEIVTLASIVQAEAARTEEMPVIASVYHNRLEQNHPLQADPTVLYALGGPRERLLYAAMDSVADSPYNTYTHPGLPPGPIGAPGGAALEASLYPEDTDFFYFVARPGGEHTFSVTLRDHNRAVSRARQSWDSLRATNTATPNQGTPPRDRP